MEPINPIGFPAPFAPPLIWIFSVINKCKFRCAFILKCTFQQCYGILRVSLSSKQISLTCTYCIWIMLVCQISCFVWEAIRTTLTWLDFDLTLVHSFELFELLFNPLLQVKVLIVFSFTFYIFYSSERKFCRDPMQCTQWRILFYFLHKYVCVCFLAQILLFSH